MPVTSNSLQTKPQLDTNVGVMFVRSDLDEYGLDPYEFRVYGHITRRTGGRENGVAFSSVKKMADACGMSTRKLQYALKVLCHAGLLRKQKNSEYRTNTYRLNAPTAWLPKTELATIRKAVKEATADNPPIKKRKKKLDERKADAKSLDTVVEQESPLDEYGLIKGVSI